MISSDLSCHVVASPLEPSKSRNHSGSGLKIHTERIAQSPSTTTSGIREREVYNGHQVLDEVRPAPAVSTHTDVVVGEQPFRIRNEAGEQPDCAETSSRARDTCRVSTRTKTARIPS